MNDVCYFGEDVTDGDGNPAGVAQDRAEHTAIIGEVTVPAGAFQGCVEVTETSPLEPGHESVKVYCPGVGLVIDGEMELAAWYRGAVTRPAAGDED